MSVGLISLFFALGAAGFCYVQIARSTGSASPKLVWGGAAIAGVIVYILFFTLLKFVLNF